IAAENPGLRRFAFSFWEDSLYRAEPAAGVLPYTSMGATTLSDLGLREDRLIWAVVIFLLMFGLSLAAVCLVVVALPEPYLVDERRRFLADKPPLVRIGAIIAKNVFGLVVEAVGIVLCIPGVPGQGLLTVLIGLMLLDIPGKRRLVRFLVRRPGVLRTLNW